MKKNFPEKIFPTRFNGYYITEDGKVFIEWDNKGKRGDLREMNSFIRGSGYLGINISIKENGKTIKQIKYYLHRLIAETLIENPKNFIEIDHIDRNKYNNSIGNLRWVSRFENMAFNARHFKITDIKTGKIYEGDNLNQWVRENWDWISKRTKTKERKNFVYKILHKKKSCGFFLEK
jgi:hypothetical protein